VPERANSCHVATLRRTREERGVVACASVCPVEPRGWHDVVTIDVRESSRPFGRTPSKVRPPKASRAQRLGGTRGGMLDDLQLFDFEVALGFMP